MPKVLKQVATDIANAFTRWSLWQGGSSTLSDMTDVSLNNLQNGDVLQYDDTNEKWINAIVSGGESLGGKVDTLWTNPNPLNVFNSQNVSINTNYDIFFVHFRPTNTSGTNYCLVISKVFNRSYYLYGNTGDAQDYQVMRAVSFNDGIVQFGDAFRPSIEFGNQYCIPTMIVGIKFAEIEPKQHEYSTTEKVIGKWIDGKPIYETTVKINSVSTDLSIYNIDFFIDYKLSGKSNYYTPTNYYVSQSDQCRSYYAFYGKIFTLYDAWNNYENTYLTFQYTKTTD